MNELSSQFPTSQNTYLPQNQMNIFPASSVAFTPSPPNVEGSVSFAEAMHGLHENAEYAQVDGSLVADVTGALNRGQQLSRTHSLAGPQSFAQPQFANNQGAHSFAATECLQQTPHATSAFLNGQFDFGQYPAQVAKPVKK